MAISPEALGRMRKSLEKDTHDKLVRAFDDWLKQRLVDMDAQAYTLPYRISWRKCCRAVTDQAPGNVWVSPPAVIFDALDKYKAEGWGIHRDDSWKGWWIFKKYVDELVFDKLPK